MAYALQQYQIASRFQIYRPKATNIVAKKPKTKEVNASIKVGNPVQPIKNKDDIQRIKEYFLNQKETYRNANTGLRNYTMFCLNLCWALRCGDLVRLHVGDIIDNKGKIVDKLNVQEGKTGKHKMLYLNKYMKDVLAHYLRETFDDYKSEGNRAKYLFFTRSGNRVTNNESFEDHISTRGYWQVMKKAQKDLNLDFNLGTHSIRKTWTYHSINEHKDDMYMVMAISKSLNHSSIAMTYHYAGFDEEVNKQLQTTLML